MRVKTRSPEGCALILQHRFNWKQLSLIAGASIWGTYFRFVYGAIKGPQLVEFLKVVPATTNGKLLTLWDDLSAHRSHVVREYVEALQGRIVLERLPGHAPGLNPVEYLIGYAKQRQLANLCADAFAEVERYPSRGLKRVQRLAILTWAPCKQAELPLSRHCTQAKLSNRTMGLSGSILQY